MAVVAADERRTIGSGQSRGMNVKLHNIFVHEPVYVCRHYVCFLLVRSRALSAELGSPLGLPQLISSLSSFYFLFFLFLLPVSPLVRAPF